MTDDAKPLPTAFYADGYTKVAVLSADLTGFSPVRMTYRPICADEDSQAIAWRKLNDGKPDIDFYAPLLARKIIDWTLKDDKDAKVPVSEPNIRRLAPAFFNKLLDVVAGYVTLPSGETEAETALKNSGAA